MLPRRVYLLQPAGVITPPAAAYIIYETDAGMAFAAASTDGESVFEIT
ncbi:MAG: hypothetical protein K6D94_06740 [Clostridiales bacterium]|nr:hypothetical protein [Clostridiales bacterium]